METVARWPLGARVSVLAVLILAAHGLALIVPFQFDDLHQIALNPAMRDPKSLIGFFTDPYLGSNLGHLWFFRPVLFVTFLVDGVVGGGSPVPYRVTSLVLLGVFAVLAGHFARVLTLRVVAGVTRSEPPRSACSPPRSSPSTRSSTNRSSWRRADRRS